MANIEEKYRGTPASFKRYLRKVLRELERKKANCREEKNFRMVSDYCQFVSEILEMEIWESYLSDSTMYSFKERVKLDYAMAKNDAIYWESQKKEDKKAFLEMYEKCGRKFVGKYEDGYDSKSQQTLESLKDEWDLSRYFYEKAERERRLLWYILGIINRPQGFFEKILNIEE